MADGCHAGAARRTGGIPDAPVCRGERIVDPDLSSAGTEIGTRAGNWSDAFEPLRALKEINRALEQEVIQHRMAAELARGQSETKRN